MQASSCLYSGENALDRSAGIVRKAGAMLARSEERARLGDDASKSEAGLQKELNSFMERARLCQRLHVNAFRPVKGA